MAKAPKTIYQCTECGGTSPKWQGKCPHCGEWNTLQESLAAPEPKNARFQSWAADTSTVQSLSAVTATEVPRNPTGMGELDRVLGGGLVDGAVILLGGEDVNSSNEISTPDSNEAAKADENAKSKKGKDKEKDEDISSRRIPNPAKDDQLRKALDLVKNPVEWQKSLGLAAKKPAPKKDKKDGKDESK